VVGVVVTGAAGFIGRVLVRTLLDAGTDVTAVDRRPFPAPVLGRGRKERLTVLTTDLTVVDAENRAALAAAFGAADAVFHLAGCPGVRDPRPDVEYRRHRDNVLATARVLDLVPLDIPLVVTSSSSVYGGAVGGRPCAERDPLSPRGGYARSKVAAERLCATRLEAGGVIAVARPFTVAGEGQRPDMALSQWIAAARTGRPLRILGSLDRTRDITDVREVARVLTTLADRAVCGTVNIGTGTGHRLGEVVSAVAAALGTPVEAVVEPAGPAEVADTLADTRVLRELVGFVPRTDLLDVVTRQAAAQPTEATMDASAAA
jgi:nucleoside-diphosphate-sugar epimerase